MTQTYRKRLHGIQLWLFAAVFFFVACDGGEQSGVDQSEVPAPEPVETYVTTTVNSFKISLQNQSGKCVLVYYDKQHHMQATSEEKSIPLDMDAPCNFVRARWKDFEPQVYPYPKDPYKRKILRSSADHLTPSSNRRLRTNSCQRAADAGCKRLLCLPIGYQSNFQLAKGQIRARQKAWTKLTL
jgi:hypothetical protein